MTFKLVPYEQLEEGEPVLAFGVHALRWKHNEWGDPTYAFVEDEAAITQTETIEKLKEALTNACLNMEEFDQDILKQGAQIARALLSELEG